MKIYKVFVFDKKLGDWCEMRYRGSVMTFPTVRDAEQYVEEYPHMGADYSRALRSGSYQIIEESHDCNTHHETQKQ